MAVTINASTTTGLVQTADTSGVLQLQTNSGTTAITIDTSQNVGIGTASPTEKLEVIGSINVAADESYRIGSGTDRFIKYRPGDSDILYSFDFGDFYRQDIGNSNHSWFTGNAERMRINSSGDVGIGITTQDTRLVVSANTGTAVQRIFNLVGTNTYQMSFHNSTQECGTITTGSNTVGYNSNSDYRLKDNVIPMIGALDKIAKLKPVRYTWKASGTNGQGFIAHELQEHFPDAVSGEKDAVNEDGKPVYQGVDTSFLVATLTAAIQEQQTIINDLTARITALEGAA